MNNENTLPVIAVSSLICHRDMPMALTCLGSLQKYSQQPIQFILHDDGSLQEEDAALLKEHLNSPVVISKKEADEKMAAALTKYPAIFEFRQSDVLAKKFLDCVYFNKGEIFAYCDTDILFVRPFCDLFCFPTDNINALMMYDLTNSYCMRSWQMMRYSGLKLPRNPNSGLLYYRRSYYDLDFIEWFLSKPELRCVPYFTEQTLWALLSWRASCRLWNPNQIALMQPDFVATDQFVAGHFVKTYRALYDDYKDQNFTAPREPIRVETVPAKLCSPLDYTACEVSRRLSRLMDR